MNKTILSFISIFFLSGLSALAENRHWVGGSGNWHDAQHWSRVSGGEGGAAIPSKEDNVYFDEHSFPQNTPYVTITEDAFCKNMNWAKARNCPAFSGSASTKLNIYGSLVFMDKMINGFLGEIHFLANTVNENKIIHSAGHVFQGDIYFEGTASTWKLEDDFKKIGRASCRERV